jgi:NADPH:quinone reductase-like Zn-dependent oxidoreductase
MQYLADLLAAGRLTPPVDRCFTLDEIVEAYRFVETGQKLGNVVVIVDAGDDDRATGAPSTEEAR